MSKLLEELFLTQDTAILRYKGGTSFVRESLLPEWFLDLWPESKEKKEFSIAGVSPFLDNFLTDAGLHWREKRKKEISSGPWIEVELENNNALEATSLLVGGFPILMIKNLGAKYESTQKMMQAVRENLLYKEQLEVEVSRRTRTIRERETEMAHRLIYAAGFRDEETGAHLIRIGQYSSAMAELLGWEKGRVEDMASAAPMHDLGKIGISDAILKKPGKLTPEEMKIMQGHARLGMEMLSGSDIPMLQLAAEVASCHHERWDGSGYPDSLIGENIPVSARIVAIVDVYDALVHKRYYKPAFSEEKSIGILKNLSGKHFDPTLLELFFENMEIMRAIRLHYPDGEALPA